MSFGTDDPVLAGTWTLIFSGTTLIQSSFVQNYKTEFAREVPIARRPKLWSSEVILDGNYPAQVWEHEFLLYNEASTPPLFAKEFMDLETKITSVAQSLILKDNGTDRIDFGSCYLDVASLEDPKELLLFRAGFLTIRFIGNTRPTIL